MIRKEIFREYDIRGIYDTELNEDTAYLIGKAYGTVLQREYDVRWNSLMDDIRKTEFELHNEERPERIRANTSILFNFIKMLPDSIS